MIVFGVLVVLGTTLSICRLGGLTDWSWWVVTAPFWPALFMLLCSLFTALVVAGVEQFYEKHEVTVEIKEN